MSSLRKAVSEEFGNLNPRLLLANCLVAILPQLSFCRLRTAIYRVIGGLQIGPRTLVFGRLSLIGPGSIRKRLRIGADCIINTPFFLDLTANISIGDRVSIGHHTVMVTAHHEIGPPSYRSGANVGRPIAIGDGCWIAARCTLLPGVSLGQSSIVAAGGVVTHDVPDNVLVAGVPARVIKELDK